MRWFPACLVLAALFARSPLSAVRPGAARGPLRALGKRRFIEPGTLPVDGGLQDLTQINEMIPMPAVDSVDSVGLTNVQVKGNEEMTLPTLPATDRYSPITIFNLEDVAKKYPRLAPCLDDIRLSSLVFPFKASPYVVDELIDWKREGSIKDDPFYRLVFPTMAMLSPEHQDRLLAVKEEPFELKKVVAQIRHELNPHPAGQKELNAPKQEGLTGVQHKYDSTVLFFPAAGQTCHAYCTYCFRWAQFIGDADLKFAQTDAESLFTYLESHEEVSDVLFTGGDPMIMKTRFLRRYLEPFKNPDFLPHIKNLRIGTRTLTFWPQRFLSDDDADEVIELFNEIRQVGRHITIMAHLGHPRELQTSKVRRAIRRLQDEARVIIRSQAPLMQGINDNFEVWAEKWRLEVAGCGTMSGVLHVLFISFYMICYFYMYI